MKPSTVREHRSQTFCPAVTDDAFAHVVGSSATIRAAIAAARQVAASPLTTVLLEGETGTGKEVFARGIHAASAPREPFVGINCAAIPGELLESELFGHERGSFTGATEAKRGLLEHAGQGTVFLDEVNQLPLELQSKLLRVLEDRMFRRVGAASEQPLRCRVIAGTNSSLDIAVAAGRFRSDLYFRLNVFHIELPPLRARQTDVLPIAERFLDELALRNGRRPPALSEKSKTLLMQHSWPGNARELRNVMERATVLCTGDTIHAEHLTLQERHMMPMAGTDGIAGMIAIPKRGKTLVEVEREAIRLTMQLTAGNLSAAAKILGLSRPTLMRKMRDAGMTRRSLLASS